MKRVTSWVLSSFVLGLALLGPVVANPKDPPRTVQDDAGFFSNEAKAKANEVIAAIKRTYDKDLMIETVTGVELPAGVDKKDDKAVDRFVDDWASKRFKNDHVDGILVVFLTDLRKFRVEVGPETLKKNFTRADEVALSKVIVGHLKKKEHDNALLHAVDFVLAAEKNHGHAVVPVKTTAPPTAPHHDDAKEAQAINWPLWIAIGIGALLLLWIIMGIARAAAGPRPGYGGGPGMGGGYGGGYGGGGGGGGFFSSLLGGMFGAAAGMWMYNSFFGGHSASYPTSNPGNTGAAGGADQSASDVGAGDPTGTGGSWGDNETGDDNKTSGGDWSGGDDAGGGGDAGGGDWGGGGGGDTGGGDWGGGGGDTGGGDWGGGGGGDFGGGGGGDW